MNIDPNTTKYLIKATLMAEGIVDKPDIIGAIFGQTEGLLGDELDLRDLQKSGRMGRLEVEVVTNKGRTESSVTIPSSLDQVETSIFAGALETVERVGPCRASVKVDSIEDVRMLKRAQIIDRAKELLTDILAESRTAGSDITDSVRQLLQTEEITIYGTARSPAGPNVASSDAIILVEGRSDVLNLLRYGIKNAVAVEGTSVPKEIQDLSTERTVTVFVDGDRGGELILRELLQNCEVDFVARAPEGREVEELTQKQIMKCLRDKQPKEQFLELTHFGEPPARGSRGRGREGGRRGGRGGEVAPSRGPAKPRAKAEPKPRAKAEPKPKAKAEPKPKAKAEPKPKAKVEPKAKAKVEPKAKAKVEPKAKTESPAKTKPEAEKAPSKPKAKPKGKEKGPEKAKPTPAQPAGGLEWERAGTFRTMLGELDKTRKARLLDAKDKVVAEVAISALTETLQNAKSPISTVIFDGIITQRLIDIATSKQIKTLVAVRVGPITKRPLGLRIFDKNQL